MAKSLFKLNIRAINKLLSCLSARSRDIVERRFGIGKAQGVETLEAIGKSYRITRERVRQLEEQSLKKIRISPAFKEIERVLADLENLIKSKGGVVCERVFLDETGSPNQISFLLVLGEDFEKMKESDNFHTRWTISREKAQEAEQALEDLHKKIKPDEVFSEDELIIRFASFQKKQESILKSWIELSRFLGQNALGEWGFVSSPQIKPRGVKDLAYLVMKQHGSPMHFIEVAKAIKNTLSLKAHPQTVHNELIKDDRFVLVGRGLYALASWGYKPGLIRDVIAGILTSFGSLSKEEIVRRVKQERYVKENTILINLHNRLFFRKNADGTYSMI